MAPIQVAQDVRDTAVIISVVGEVDSSSVATLVPHLDAALKVASAHAARLLVVELAHVTYFGSAGLNAVLQCYENGRDSGVAVRVVAANPEVVRPIEVTKLDGVLRPYRTVADAVGGVEPQ